MQARIHIRRIAKPGLSRLGRQPPTLSTISEALLAARSTLFERCQKLEKRPRSRAREDSRARLLMTTPGVDTMVSHTYASVIDDPHRFRSSKAVLRENSCRADQSD
jgi:transposase